MRHVSRRLAHVHARGEPGARGRLAHHQRRSRNVGDPRPGPDDAPAGPPLSTVEPPRPSGWLEPGPSSCAGMIRGGDLADGMIAEVRQQPVQPPRPRHAVGVDDGTKAVEANGQPGVPRRSRESRPPSGQRARPVLGADRRDRLRIGGSNRRRRSRAAGRAAPPGTAPVPRNRPAPESRPSRQPRRAEPSLPSGSAPVRVRDPCVQQPPRERPRRRGAARHRYPGKPPRHLRAGRRVLSRSTRTGALPTRSIRALRRAGAEPSPAVASPAGAVRPRPLRFHDHERKSPMRGSFVIMKMPPASRPPVWQARS